MASFRIHSLTRPAAGNHGYKSQPPVPVPSLYFMIIRPPFSLKTASGNSWYFYLLSSCLCLIAFLKQSVTAVALLRALCYSSADLSYCLSSEQGGNDAASSLTSYQSMARGERDL